jgi:hypothetical protein
MGEMPDEDEIKLLLAMVIPGDETADDIDDGDVDDWSNFASDSRRPPKPTNVFNIDADIAEGKRHFAAK